MTREKMVKRLSEGIDSLEVSIEKWSDVIRMLRRGHIAAGIENGLTGHNCALCFRYFNAAIVCLKCPIYEKTNEHSCQKTPFIDFAAYASSIKNMKNIRKYRGKLIELAYKELDFLKSLR